MPFQITQVTGRIDRLGARLANTHVGDDAEHNIALELPNSALGGAAGLNLWHRVLVPADGAGSGWVQVERGARASQTPFMASEARDAYLSAEPAQDERFVAVFAHALEHMGFYTSEEAQTAARAQLPDVLRYDRSRPVEYPTNGRALTDDVVDFFLGVLTNGTVTQDKVGPHADLLEEFPYVGTPHHAMRPTADPPGRRVH